MATRNGGVSPLRMVLFALTVAGVFFPLFAFERVTNHLFLAGLPLYGTFSGLRIELFVASVFVAGLATGGLLDDFYLASGSVVIGVVAFLVIVYSACDPRLCYSTGILGLEPVRFGGMLLSLGVSGARLGVRSSKGVPSEVVTAFCATYALGFFPMMFSLAGAELLPPAGLWASAFLLALAAGWGASVVSRVAGLRAGVMVPLFGWGLLALLSSTLALDYLADEYWTLAMLFISTFLGAALGSGLVPNNGVRRVLGSRPVMVAPAVLLLVMTVGVIPEAVNGLVPSAASPGQFVGTAMGAPLFAGGYMDAPLGATKGVGATVSFRGTDPNAIGADNFLAVGIGAHSPGCCVDGIDYGYRFDAYLFRNGSSELLAQAWKVCDFNAACGGHSWKVLMTLGQRSLGTGVLTSNISLRMQWVGHSVEWEYSVNGSPFVKMAEFHAEKAENPFFDTGKLTGFSFPWNQEGSFFLQFGVLSRYPVASEGWRATVYCPSYASRSEWTCVSHASALQGDQSFWKALWRWGDPYPGVGDTVTGSQTVSFSYSSSNQLADFQKLW